MNVIAMTDLDLAGRRVLIREDLNVPVKDGAVAGDARLRAAIPTLQRAAQARARVMVMSHLGRRRKARRTRVVTCAGRAPPRGAARARVRLVEGWLDGVDAQPGEIVLCENVRFLAGETTDDETLARRMAALCDVYVMDAFGTAHRAQASTHGVARYAPIACAGPLLAAELDALGRALARPARPLVAIVGGSKVSTKLGVLEALSARVDRLITGGGIAQYVHRRRRPRGGRLAHEPDLVGQAVRIRDAVRQRGGDLPISERRGGADSPSDRAVATVKAVGEVGTNEMILDIGPETARGYRDVIDSAGTVLWNGPVGVFELAPFATGTRDLAHAIARGPPRSRSRRRRHPRGDRRVRDHRQVSTSPPAAAPFLEFLEGKTLPAIAVLEARAASSRRRPRGRAGEIRRR